MNPHTLLRTQGCIRSGEWIGPDYKRLPIPDGFRYYWRGRGVPERVRGAVEKILRDHPRTQYVIAPRY